MDTTYSVQPLHAVAAHAYASLHEIARYLDSGSAGNRTEPLTPQVAATVRGLFVRLAWSDGTLHRLECDLMEALMRTDEAYGGHLNRLVQEKGAMDDDLGHLPPLLRVALTSDSHLNTQISILVLDALESLANAVVAADGRVTPAEQDSVDHTFRHLRRLVEC